MRSTEGKWNIKIQSPIFRGMCFVIKTRFFSNDPEFREIMILPFVRRLESLDIVFEFRGNIWKFDLVNGFAIWDFKNHSGQMRF